MNTPVMVRDEEGREARVDPELITILFGGVIENGLTEVTWEDLPKLAAALTRAGLTVRGEYVETDFRKEPVLSVELKIRVKTKPTP